MLSRSDYLLAIIVVGLNFFMMVIEESSLYTILPKYLSNRTLERINNNSKVSESNFSMKCILKDPPYVIVSMIFLSKNLVTILINPLIGMILDRMNNFIILIFAQILGVCVLLIYAFSSSILMYIVGRIIDAFVTCVIFVAVYSIISQMFLETRMRSKYYGFVNTLFSVSHSIGPVYGASVDENFGKSTVFLLLIPVWLISLFFTYLLHQRVNKINKNRKGASRFLKLMTNHNISNTDGKISNYESRNLIFSEASEKDDAIKTETENKKSNRNCRKLFTIFKMLKDPLVLACLIQIFVVNLSMFSLPPTLPSWMAFRLCSSELQQGIVWSFGFVGYILGVLVIILIDAYAPRFRNLAPVGGQIIIGILLIMIPFTRDWRFLFLPIIGMYISVGVVEQVILPLTTYLSDSLYNSNYGTMSSLTSQSLNICSVISTLCSGPLADKFGFTTLAILLGIINLSFCPISLIHRKVNPNS